MTQVFNIKGDDEITPVQRTAADIAASKELDPAQSSIYTKVSNMVSEGVLSLSNMYKEATSSASEETSASIRKEYQQYQQLTKEAEEAKGYSLPQQGMEAVAKKVKNKEYTLNPAKLKSQVAELGGYTEEQIKGLQRQLKLPDTGKADEDTASNLILYKNYLGENKASTLLKEIVAGSLEGLRTNPMPNSKVMQSPLMQFGDDAVQAIERREGALSYTEQRVAEEEGYFNGFYYDSKNVLTFGAGQTKAFMDKSFKETVAARTKTLEAKLTDFNSFPEELQAELVQSAYRGGLTGSPTAIKLINKQQYQAGAKAFLDNVEYKQAKRAGSGIATRMEKTARAIRLLSSL
jgi:GH24 family phage-related lysozyme (muramidase)